MAIGITIEDMKDVDSITYPTIKMVRETIQDIVDKVSNEHLAKTETHQITNSFQLSFRGMGDKKFIDSDFSMSIRYDLFDISKDKTTPISGRAIYVFVFQDTRSGEFSVTITNDVKHKLNILFSCITQNPIVLLEKYLPNILCTSIKILKSEYED